MFFLVLLLGLIAFVGLVIDGAGAFSEKRHVQNAADAAALAAVQDTAPALDPSCDNACREGYRAGVKARAEQYSAENGGAASLAQCSAVIKYDCYTWPYPDASKRQNWARIEVRLRKAAEGFFTNVLGLGTSFFKPSGRAVASAVGPSETHCVFTGEPPVPNPDDYLPGCVIPGSPGTGMFAFAMSTDCKAIEITGSEHNFYTGALWSNGGIGANNKNYAKVYRFGNTSCADGTKFTDCGASAPPCSIPPGTHVAPTYVAQRSPGDWPIPLPNTPAICPGGVYAPGGATVTSAWLSAHPPGIYCFTDTVDIQASFSGYGFATTKIASNAIKSSTNGLTVTGAAEFLFYAVNGGIALTPGDGMNLNGHIFAPNDLVNLTGKNNTNTGYIMADTIKITNNGTTFVGDGPGLDASADRIGTPVETVSSGDPALDE